ncbi:hypothetical protein CLOM_g21574 [Closterium sp. NIES-68]|nr:hypothetical protein CLOM_g21574 [Closterium sp. NIES-68]GJP71370.1 hypothetical protein CLOP_g2209 [Closterium sp. NIES-67]
MGSVGTSTCCRRTHHTRSASASFRALAVTTAQQFALLSLPSSPADSADSSPARGNATARRAGSASHSPPPPSTCFQVKAGTTGDCRVAQSGGSPSVTDHVTSRQSTNDAGPETPSTARDESTSPVWGLSLQLLQHLAALTATNDNPRDTSSASFFPYASSRDGPQGRRSRLTLDSSQRRLDSWNRATRTASGKRFEDIRTQRRLNRSRSEPSPVRSAGAEDSFDSLRPARPLDAVVSEAWKQMLRHSLRRSRSAHALGEKDTNALWSDAMTALMWRHGGAVIYRRPDGQAASESAAELANSHDRQVSDTRQQILPTASSANSGRAGLPLVSGANAATNAAVTSRCLPSPLAQTYLPSSAASQRPDDSQKSRPWSSASACGRLAAQAASYDCCRVRTAPSAAAHRACDSRTVQLTEMSSRTHAPAVSMSVTAAKKYQEQQRRQQQQQTLNTDPVKSVFAWAAEQRIASRRAQRAQQ